jgi:hypothetical protein
VNGPETEDQRVARRALLRKATFQLVLGVVALDAVALAIYYAGGIAHGSTQTRQIFTAVWLVATAVTVAVLLKRVRAVRFRR